MILTALHDLAVREDLDPVYEPKEVHYLVQLDRGGALLGILETPRERQLDPRGRPRGPARPAKRPIPRRSERKSQNRAEFLVDKAEYVFGVAAPTADVTKAEGLAERARIRRRLFREWIVQAAGGLPGNEAIRAVEQFLGADEVQRSAQLQQWLHQKADEDPKALEAELFAFAYVPHGNVGCVHDMEDVRDYFAASLMNAEGARRGQCLVTGKQDVELTKIHAAPKGIPPLSLTKGGVPLTSVNNAAFCSYDLDAVGGAPISVQATHRIDAALTRLLDPAYPGPDGNPLATRRVDLTRNTVLVYWSREDAAVGFLSGLDAADPEQVAAQLRSPHKGRPAAIEDPTAFFALVLSGTQGRGIVRSFVESTVRDVARSIDRYFADTRVCRPFGDTDGTYPLIELRRSLVFRGDLERLPPNLAVQLFMSILSGRRYPRTILDAAVRRNRVDLFPKQKGSDGPDQRAIVARCSLIKAYLVRNLQLEVPVSLDVTRPEPAYRIGRLLAVLDKVQGDALGKLNASIVDRYYGSASSTPAAVVPTLLRRAQHHLGKLRREKRGLGIEREKLLQEVLAGLTTFPATLNLEHQGLFALGFYHQRQALYVKKEGDVR